MVTHLGKQSGLHCKEVPILVFADAPFKVTKAEQFRSKRDATDRDVWSGSPQFANIEVYSNSNKKCYLVPLNSGRDLICSFGLGLKKVNNPLKVRLYLK